MTHSSVNLILIAVSTILDECIFIKNALSHRKASVLWSSIRAVGKISKSDNSAHDFSADEFRIYFASVYSSLFRNCNDINFSSEGLPDFPLCLQVSEVENLMRQVKRKSPGPDGIPHWVFRDYASILAPAVSSIFNRSLNCGTVPSCFKVAHLTPIPKSSNAKKVNDFRPISLLPILSKMLEKLVAVKWILPFIKNKLSQTQFAYLPGPGKGTTSALTLLYHRVLQFLDKESGSVRVLTLDYAKAFDRLPHSAILESACNFKLPFQAVQWIHNFLTDRRQRVHIPHSTSDWFCVPSGVPQGSVLGPLLFCLVIDNLSPICPNSDMLKFADDVTLLHYVRTPSDDCLAKEWNSINAWSARVGLSLNIEKCSVMDISTKRSLRLSPISELANKDHTKILGVTFSSDLSWNKHIDIIVSKANKRIFVMRNLKRSGCPPQILCQVYKALIQSVLTYSFPVFCNLPKYLMDRLLRVERRILKLIGNDSAPSLTTNAERQCKKLFSNILRDSTHPLRELFIPREPTFRNRCTLRPPRTRTKRFGNSFLRFCFT